MFKQISIQRIFIKKNILLRIFLLVIVTWLPYLNSFDCAFQLDDYHTIQVNQEIGNIARFADLSLWSGFFYNRQLVNLTYTFNYLIGGFDLFGYHLFNLIIHIINSLLVFFLVRNIFETNAIKENGIDQSKDDIAFFTALIFAVHPIQIQAVTYITQRLVSMAIMFYLISLNLYLSARLNQNRFCILKYFLSVISFLLGMYCKEIIFTLPITLLFIELLFFRKTNNKLDLRFIVPLAIIVVAGLIFVLLKMGFPVQPEAPKHYHYFLTQLTVLVTYIRLLFLPINQHLYYLVQIRESIFELQVLFSLLILFSVIAIGIYFYKRNRLLSFAIGWFFITQLVESTVFPLKFLLFEYRVYPAVLSLGIILSVIVFTIIRKNTAAVTVMSVIAIIFGLLTFNHNFDWKTPISLWQNNVKKEPNYSVSYESLGKQYMMIFDFENAHTNFNKAIELDSNSSESYAHRAIIFSDNGNFYSALKDANRAIDINSTNPLYYNNRGYVYQSQKDFVHAEADFRKAIEVEPRYHNAMKNLSIILYYKNNLTEALEWSNKSIELDSTKEEYYNNRGNIYFAMGNYFNAEKDFRKAVQLYPKYAKALNNVGVVLLKQNKFDEAIDCFTKTIEISDNAVDSYYYRGYALIRKGMMQEAYYDLIKCLNLETNHQGAINLLNQFFKQN